MFRRAEEIELSGFRQGNIQRGDGRWRDLVARVDRRHRRWLRGVTTAMAIGLTAAPWVYAADSGSGKPGADIAAAQALFERGRELMVEGRAEEACPLFEESQRLDAGLGTQYNLANCYEVLGRVASAHTLFLEVAATAQARGQAERARAAASRAHGVEPKLSRLIIEIETEQRAALTVERDGNVVGSPQWGLAVAVDPGLHRVRARGPGLVPWAREIDIGTSPEVHTVRIPSLALEARAPAACDPTTGDGCGAREGMAPGSESFLASARHELGLGALGVGVAGLGISVGLAIVAHSKNTSSETAGCDDRGCPTPASLSLRREAISAGNWATVSAAVGLAGVAAAGLLFWVVPEPAAPTSSGARVLPHVTGESTGVDVYGRF